MYYLFMFSFFFIHLFPLYLFSHLCIYLFPHLFIYLYLYLEINKGRNKSPLSSPAVAGVWSAHWRCCAVAAVGIIQVGCCTLVVVEERPPSCTVKHFGCTALHNKVLYKCLIHSFIHSFFTFIYFYISCP